MNTTYPTRAELVRALDALQAAFSLPCPAAHLAMFEQVTALGQQPSTSRRIAQTPPAAVCMEDVSAALCWLHTAPAPAFQHFLPRVFAIMCLEGGGYWEASGIARELHRLRWTQWPLYQRHAIRQLVECWIRRALHEPTVPIHELEEALALGQALLPSRVWLTEGLQADPEGRVLRRLVGWLGTLADPMAAAMLALGGALVGAVQRSCLEAVLEEAFFDPPDGLSAEVLSAAVDHVGWYLR